MTTAYSVKEIAERLGVDESTVRAWIRNREMRSVNLSRNRHSKKPRLKVTEEELVRFIESRSSELAVKQRQRHTPPPTKSYV